MVLAFDAYHVSVSAPAVEKPSGMCTFAPSLWRYGRLGAEPRVLMEKVRRRGLCEKGGWITFRKVSAGTTHRVVGVGAA